MDAQHAGATEKSARTILRAERFEEKLRSCCAQLERGPGEPTFHIRGEKQFPNRHAVFVRVRLEDTRSGFYVVPYSKDCVVHFFREHAYRPGFGKRLQRLLAGSSYYGTLDDDFEPRRKRVILHSGCVQPHLISHQDISEWLEYACSNFERRRKPAILKGRQHP